MPVQDAERAGRLMVINPVQHIYRTIIASINMDAIRGRE